MRSALSNGNIAHDLYVVVHSIPNQFCFFSRIFGTGEARHFDFGWQIEHG